MCYRCLTNFDRYNLLLWHWRLFLFNFICFTIDLPNPMNFELLSLIFGLQFTIHVKCLQILRFLTNFDRQFTITCMFWHFLLYCVSCQLFSIVFWQVQVISQTLYYKRRQINIYPTFLKLFYQLKSFHFLFLLQSRQFRIQFDLLFCQIGQQLQNCYQTQ